MSITHLVGASFPPVRSRSAVNLSDEQRSASPSTRRKRVRHPDAIRDARRKRWERIRMPLYTTIVVVGTFIGIMVLLDAVARGVSRPVGGP